MLVRIRSSPFLTDSSNVCLPVFHGLLISPQPKRTQSPFWLLLWKCLVFVWICFTFSWAEKFLFSMFRLSISISKFLFLGFFFTFLRVAQVYNDFSIKKGENLAWLTSYKDSMIVNLGSLLPHSPNMIRIHLLFSFFLNAISDVYFSLVLCSTPTGESNLCLERTKGETRPV